MKLKGIFPALSLATLMALGGCGGGGADDSGGSASSLFSIQGQRTLEAFEGDSIAVTATAVSQASATGLSGRWIIAGGTTLTRGDSPAPGRFGARNMDCAENAVSGTGENADNLPTVGRYTCTVFLDLPALSKPNETINLTFQGSDPRGNSASETFSVRVSRLSAPGSTGPVQLSVNTQTQNGNVTASSVNIEEGQSGSFRISASGRLSAITSASVSQISGGQGVLLSNQDCSVATVNNGSFNCVVGFTAPPSVSNFTPFEFQVQAVDNSGSVGATTVRLVVSPKNAGTLSAGVSVSSTLNNPARFEPGRAQDLQCFSSGGVGPIQYRWSVNRPANNTTAPVIQTSQTDDQATRTSTLRLLLPNAEVEGVYTATCMVTDANGVTASGPTVFFNLSRSEFVLRVAPGSRNEPFNGGDTISLVADILDLDGIPVGDPQNYAVSFVPNVDLASFGQQQGNTINYDIIAPRFSGGTDRVFSVNACAVKRASLPSGVTNACSVASAKLITYTFKVRPTVVSNQPATIADASLVNSSSIFSPGDTVMLSGQGTQAVNGATLSDVFYYWTIATPNSGLVLSNPRAQNPSIELPANVAAGSYRVTLFTSLQNTNSATPPPADVRSEDSVDFTVNVNNNVVVQADAGSYPDFRFGVGQNPNIVLSNGNTVFTNLNPNRTVGYQWFQIEGGNIVAIQNACSDPAMFLAEAQAQNPLRKAALVSDTSPAPSFNATTVTPEVGPDQMDTLFFVLRANVRENGAEIASDCDVTSVKLIGASFIQASAGVDEVKVDATATFDLVGTGTRIENVLVPADGTPPPGINASWGVVEARDLVGAPINVSGLIISSKERFLATVTLGTAQHPKGTYVFDLIVSTGQERKADNSPYNLNLLADRIQFGMDFPARRSTVQKTLTN